MDVVRLRWMALRLGMEKIVLKSEMMICYFPADQQSPYYQSPVFGKILGFLQSNPRKCRMKEEGKLTLTFPGVRNTGEAVALLQEIG